VVSDLKDGVRLARLVEVVTGRVDEVSRKLRVPALSRLNKVSSSLS